MNIEEINGKKIMHIDTSCKLYEKKHTAIAYNTIRENKHKGCILKSKLKRELEKDLSADYDYARIYAICIYYLIKKDLDEFNILVICGDEHFPAVKGYLENLFFENEGYPEKEIISISELRTITGNSKLRSYADNRANSYRKRGAKPLYRRQKGVSLNMVDINYKMICKKWMEIENKKGSGE